jgi:hypothetical protein
VPALPGRLDDLLRRSLADLDGLLLADPMAPADRFTAAGSPWFCTLFGRDSLRSARLLLPTPPSWRPAAPRARSHLPHRLPAQAWAAAGAVAVVGYLSGWGLPDRMAGPAG